MKDFDDEIDALLQDRRITPVTDNGFTDRLMNRLPHRRVPRRWAVPTLSSIGFLLAAPALLDTRLLSALSELVSSSNPFVLPVIAGVFAWTACLWALIGERASAT
jgi:hypothetical protein